MSIFLLFFFLFQQIWKMARWDTSVYHFCQSILMEGFPPAFLIRTSVVCIHAHVCGFSPPLFIYLFIYFSPQNLQWARDVLLGSSISWQQLKHMPAQGLFCERNKTNLFNVSPSLTPHSLPCHHVITRCFIRFGDACHHWIYWLYIIVTAENDEDLVLSLVTWRKLLMFDLKASVAWKHSPGDENSVVEIPT